MATLNSGSGIEAGQRDGRRSGGAPRRMTRRRQRLLLLALAALAAGVLPSLLIVTLSYRQAVDDAERQLSGHAQLLQQRTDDLFGNAEATLADLGTRIDRSCSDANRELLRRAIYNSLHFREAGLIFDEAVQCTSIRAFNPPVPITIADHQTAPLDGIHIAAPDLTLEQEVSIIVNHGVADDLSVNLLMNPDELTAIIEAVIGVATEAKVSAGIGTLLGVSLEADVEGTRPLPRAGVSPPAAETAMPTYGLRGRIERLDGALLARAGMPENDPATAMMVATQRSARYPLQYTVTGNRALLLQRWRDNALWFVALGLSLSLPLFLLLARIDRRERSMDAQLREALASGELQVQYQPIHASSDGRMVGAEALLRWAHPEMGQILPSVFVPIAEQTGLIVPITRWLMKTVRTEMAEVIRDDPAFHIALNLSPQHFADPKLPTLVTSIFSGTFPPSRLVFEVTERELLSPTEGEAVDVIERLRSTGVRIALDDFGSGYSSMRTLAQFRFDLLKIDKLFVDAIGTDLVTAGLVEDMAAIARRLGIAVIAEGVETAAQADYLKKLNITYLQGWHFAPALSVAGLIAYRNALREVASGKAPIAASVAAPFEPGLDRA